MTTIQKELASRIAYKLLATDFQKTFMTFMMASGVAWLEGRLNDQQFSLGFLDLARDYQDLLIEIKKEQ